MVRVVRRLAFALGLAAAASLLRVVAGCGSSSNAPGSPDGGGDATSTSDAGAPSDAGDGGGDQGDTSALCFGGCLCFAADACPPGCYASQSVDPADGVTTFCSNGIVECSSSGTAWSFGESTSCPGLNPPGSRVALPDYPVTYLDGGPDGAFCCDLEHEYAAAAEAAADTGADASAEAGGDAGAPCMANSDCPTGDWCLFRVGDCSAHGQCVSPASLGALCNIAVAYCGCNGAIVMGLCGQPYAFGPTLGRAGDSACAE